MVIEYKQNAVRFEQSALATGSAYKARLATLRTTEPSSFVEGLLKVT